MENKLGFFPFILLFIFIGCSGDGVNTLESTETGPAALTILNNKYGEDQAQSIDLYLPANRSTSETKVLILLHGGGWIQGDKRDMGDYIPMLLKDHPNHAIVNMNYRLAKPGIRAAFPNQFLDLQMAIKHLGKEAENLGIKPEFGLIGVSAGGHIALQYDNVYDDNDLVKMVSSIVGPTNFKDPYYSQNANFNLAMGYLVDRNSYPGITDIARAVSPAYLINKNSSPTILFYGEKDELVPVSNGEFLKERLQAEGIDHSLTIYPGGHGDWQEDSNIDLQLKLNDFIDIYLRVN